VAEARDVVNLEFVQRVIGPSRIQRATIVCRAPNAYPLIRDVRVIPAAELA
jgi:hypothetical protein